MTDVLIVGAGPAGALAALVLARAGVRVRLVDRARFPRAKLCGDTLNPGALRILRTHGLDAPVRDRGIPLDGMLLTGPGAVVRGCYGAGAHGYAVTRVELDHLLVEQAVAAGVTFHDGVHVRGPLVSGPSGRVTGIDIAAPGRRLQERAALVIAADGQTSRLARAAGLVVSDWGPRRWAVGAYFSGVTGLVRAGEMHVRRGHYIGVAPSGGGLANACLVASPGTGTTRWRDPDRLLQRTLLDDPLLGPRFREARLAHGLTVLGPLGVRLRAPGVPGLLLAGDAAGFIDPMTGDGLRLALTGGELAARIALEVLAGRLAPDQAPAALAKARRRALQAKLRFNRSLRWLVSSPPAIRASVVLARTAPAVFERVIRYAGDAQG